MDRQKELIGYLFDQRDRENNQYKRRAFDKVINGVVALSGPIVIIDDLSKVEGIGMGIRRRIEEFFSTLPLQRDGIEEQLLAIHGIGPKTIPKLIAAGIKSIDDLRTRQDELLHDKQIIGLKYLEPLKLRIPRAEMERHVEMIISTAREVDPTLSVTGVGSYRRGRPDSGDIDCLISHPQDDFSKFVAFVQLLKKKSYLIEEFSFGEHKFLGIGRLTANDIPRQVDLLFTPIAKLASSMLYFTGSQEHNIKMRRIALDKGYSLSEHGFKEKRIIIDDNGKESKKWVLIDQHFADEGAIFNFLGMEYLEPEKRV